MARPLPMLEHHVLHVLPGSDGLDVPTIIEAILFDCDYRPSAVRVSAALVALQLQGLVDVVTDRVPGGIMRRYRLTEAGRAMIGADRAEPDCGAC